MVLTLLRHFFAVVVFAWLREAMVRLVAVAAADAIVLEVVFYFKRSFG